MRWWRLLYRFFLLFFQIIARISQRRMMLTVAMVVRLHLARIVVILFLLIFCRHHTSICTSCSCIQHFLCPRDCIAEQQSFTHMILLLASLIISVQFLASQCVCFVCNLTRRKSGCSEYCARCRAIVCRLECASFGPHFLGKITSWLLVFLYGNSTSNEKKGKENR